MSITAKCGSCQKAYKVEDQWAGKKVRCKNCGEVFAIPKVVVGVPLTDGGAVPPAKPQGARPQSARPQSAAKPAPARKPAAPVSKPAPKPASSGDPFDNLDALMALEQTGTVDESAPQDPAAYREPAGEEAPAYAPPARGRKSAGSQDVGLAPPPYTPPKQTLSYARPGAQRSASGDSAAVETLVHTALPILIVLIGWGVPFILQLLAVLHINHGVIYLLFAIQQGLFFGIILNGTTFGVQQAAINSKFEMPELPRLKVLAILCSWGLTTIVVALCMGVALGKVFGAGPGVGRDFLNAILSICLVSLVASLGVGYFLFKLWFRTTWVQAIVGYLFLVIFLIISTLAAGVVNFLVMRIFAAAIRATSGLSAD